MDIRFVTSGGGDAVAVMGGEGGQLFAAGQALDAASSGRIGKALKAARFTGATGQAVDVFAPDGVDYQRVIVIGVGKADAADAMAVERWAGAAVKRMLTGGAEKIALMPDALPGVAAADVAAHAAMGARLAAYRFDTYRTKMKPDQTPTLKAVDIVTRRPGRSLPWATPSNAPMPSFSICAGARISTSTPSVSRSRRRSAKLSG